MAEDTHTAPDGMSIPGLAMDDITPHIYEGGFKTWEGAVDLARYLLLGEHAWFNTMGRRDVHIIELGAGTALPSLALFQQWLRRHETTTSSTPKLSLTLADYNQAVLELATIPNLFLSWKDRGATAGGECDASPEILESFQADLEKRNIAVSAVSGCWGPALVSLVSSLSSASSKPVDTLILASETIYSPSSIHAFTHVLLDLICDAERTGGTAKALVAAKRVYFGVGGGVDEFLRVLEQLRLRGRVLWESKGVGVGRVILEVVQVRD